MAAGSRVQPGITSTSLSLTQYEACGKKPRYRHARMPAEVQLLWYRPLIEVPFFKTPDGSRSHHALNGCRYLTRHRVRLLGGSISLRHPPAVSQSRERDEKQESGFFKEKDNV